MSIARMHDKKIQVVRFMSVRFNFLLFLTLKEWGRPIYSFLSVWRWDLHTSNTVEYDFIRVTEIGLVQLRIRKSVSRHNK